MPNSVGSVDSYPGQDLSVLQLLHAARKKMQDTTLGGRWVWHVIFDVWYFSTQVPQDRDDTEQERGEV